MNGLNIFFEDPKEIPFIEDNITHCLKIHEANPDFPFILSFEEEGNKKSRKFWSDKKILQIIYSYGILVARFTPSYPDISTFLEKFPNTPNPSIIVFGPFSKSPSFEYNLEYPTYDKFKTDFFHLLKPPYDKKNEFEKPSPSVMPDVFKLRHLIPHIRFNDDNIELGNNEETNEYPLKVRTLVRRSDNSSIVAYCDPGDSLYSVIDIVSLHKQLSQDDLKQITIYPNHHPIPFDPVYTIRDYAPSFVLLDIPTKTSTSIFNTIKNFFSNLFEDDDFSFWDTKSRKITDNTEEEDNKDISYDDSDDLDENISDDLDENISVPVYQWDDIEQSKSIDTSENIGEDVYDDIYDY